MKILMAAMSMGLGGAETHVFELSRALASRGHEVTVASAGGIYAEKLPVLGVKHEKIPLASKSPFAVFRAVCLLSRLLEKERFDVVHAHARIPAFILGKLKKKYGFAFVTTVHFDFRVNPVLRRISDWGERTLAVSDDLAESAAQKYGLAREKITVIRNGIDVARFSPQVDGKAVRARLGMENRKIIMYLGRLDGDSFLPARELIRAAEAIYRAENGARILIVGEGSEKRALSAEVRRVNLRAGEEIAVLAGGTDTPEEYFAACDIFVGPSRSALEALACGTPAVLAGNFGMLGAFSPETAREALRTNFCCRGSAPATAERISAEVLRLLSLTESEKKALSAFGRDFVKKQYSAAAMAEACEAEYRALVTEKGKGIVLCGYYGAGNAGDEAMLGVLVSYIKGKIGAGKITVISSDPTATAREYGVAAVSRSDISAISRALAKADVLIFGGGNLLQDKTSTRSLLYYAQMARLARKCACRVAFSANGIGPVTNKSNFKTVKKALECADYISMRDIGSLALARRLVGEERVFASGELAFLRESGASAEKRRYFAVFPKSVENFCFDELVKFCGYVRRKYGLLPVFAPMHLREDAPACRWLAEKTGGALCLSLKNGVRLASAADFCVCMRLHAAVFSASAGTPVIAVSDDAKIASVMRGSGASVFSPGVSSATLFRVAEEIFAEKDEKKKLLVSFAEEQRRLAAEELARLCEHIL
jgi:polysaccharide pyruvyl transferase CsaB